MCGCNKSMSNCSGDTACAGCAAKQSNYIPVSPFRPPHEFTPDLPTPSPELVALGLGGSKYSFPHPGGQSNATGTDLNPSEHSFMYRLLHGELGKPKAEKQATPNPADGKTICTKNYWVEDDAKPGMSNATGDLVANAEPSWWEKVTAALPALGDAASKVIVASNTQTTVQPVDNVGTPNRKSDNTLYWIAGSVAFVVIGIVVYVKWIKK